MSNSAVDSIRRRLRLWRRKVRLCLDLLNIFYYDIARFLRYSGVYRKYSHPQSLASLITKKYHRIEKGLALPQPRPGFGESGIRELCALVTQAIADDICRDEVILAIDALGGYRDFNQRHGIPPTFWLTRALKVAERVGIIITGSPVKAASGCPILESSPLDMILSRCSVRDFSGALVPDEVLLNAVRAAQHAPCVCNSQSGRVHLLHDKAVKEAALSYQNGNRGFGDIASVIAIITVDQSEMLEAAERYQHWIDGGMFAQNFLLGLHAQG